MSGAVCQCLKKDAEFGPLRFGQKKGRQYPQNAEAIPFDEERWSEGEIRRESEDIHKVDLMRAQEAECINRRSPVMCEENRFEIDSSAVIISNVNILQRLTFEFC